MAIRKPRKWEMENKEQGEIKTEREKNNWTFYRARKKRHKRVIGLSIKNGIGRLICNRKREKEWWIRSKI